MKSQTLASAFQAAVTRTARAPVDETPASRNEILLLALQRSATERDQIVQRRIGLQSATTVGS
jgi:hypothetical protein